jgi:hypothetical protein
MYSVTGEPGITVTGRKNKTGDYPEVLLRSNEASRQKITDNSSVSSKNHRHSKECPTKARSGALQGDEMGTRLFTDSR